MPFFATQSVSFNRRTVRFIVACVGGAAFLGVSARSVSAAVTNAFTSSPDFTVADWVSGPSGQAYSNHFTLSSAVTVIGLSDTIAGGPIMFDIQGPGVTEILQLKDHSGSILESVLGPGGSFSPLFLTPGDYSVEAVLTTTGSNYRYRTLTSPVSVIAQISSPPSAYYGANFQVQPTVTPEPASLALLSVGVMGLASRRKQRR